MITTIVMIAKFAIILYSTGKVCFNKFFNVAAATAHYLYSIVIKHIECTIANITGKHHFDTDTVQYMNNSRFTSATLRRRQYLSQSNFTIIDSEYCIMVTMAEMIIDHPFFCWYSYFHHSIIYFL